MHPHTKHITVCLNYTLDNIPRSLKPDRFEDTTQTHAYDAHLFLRGKVFVSIVQSVCLIIYYTHIDVSIQERKRIGRSDRQLDINTDRQVHMAAEVK